MRRERLVEPVARQDTGESEPESWGIAALSPGVETEGAARVACGADAPARHGGKCTRIAGNRGTFPGRRKRQVQREGPVKPVPSNEKRLAALGSRGRGPPRSGGRAWSFRLLDFHRYSADGNGRCRERCLWSRCPDKLRGKVHQNRRKSRHFPRGRGGCTGCLLKSFEKVQNSS